MTTSTLVFISYAQFDDEFEAGALSRFRAELSHTLRFVSGGEVTVFNEGTDIEVGQPVQEHISQSLNEAMVLVPVITPSFFKDPACQNILTRFLERERQLGRNDLVLAVYYHHVPALETTSDDLLIHDIAQRRMLDWQPLRGKDFSAPQVRQEMEFLAKRIIAIIDELKVVQQAGATTPSQVLQSANTEHQQSAVELQLSSELVDLLGTFVQAARSLPRDQRQPFTFASMRGSGKVVSSVVDHPGLLNRPMKVPRGDIEDLTDIGFIRQRPVPSASHTTALEFDITQRGYNYYDQRMTAPFSRAAQVRKQALETQLANLAHDLQAEYQRLSATPPGADYERIRRSINLIEQEMKRAEEELAQLR